MRCGCPVEIGGFRWKLAEIDSYKIDYSGPQDHAGAKKPLPGIVFEYTVTRLSH